MDPVIILIVVMVIVLVGATIGLLVYQHLEKKRIREQIYNLADDALEMTPEEFFEMRDKSFGGRGRPKYSNLFDFRGIYILYNHCRDWVYVGQGKKVMDRVYAHFTGRGNGDIYHDYKCGDYFSIRMLALENSGFHSLNELERHTIDAFDAYARGYNKTRGNR